jgi:hypothetical protein
MDWKDLPGMSTLANYRYISISVAKGFITLGPRVRVIKAFPLSLKEAK